MGSKGPFAMQDQDGLPVEEIEISNCIFEAGGGIVTFGSEATIVRNGHSALHYASPHRVAAEVLWVKLPGITRMATPELKPLSN